MTVDQLFEGIDGPMFKKQRQALSRVIDTEGYRPDEEDLEVLEGLRNFMDSVADVANDEYGKDTLFHGISLNFYRCECGEEWEDSWDCSCNDCCPSCNKEIEPYKTVEG